MTAPGEITIRPAQPHDRAALDRLAQLDSRPSPAGPHLLAEEGGSVRAALPLDGGEPIADPFHRTQERVALLELRWAQLAAAPSRRPRLQAPWARVLAPVRSSTPSLGRTRATPYPGRR